MILTHESGSQEDQFDEKKWRQKISWDYPFKLMVHSTVSAKIRCQSPEEVIESIYKLSSGASEAWTPSAS